MAIDQIIERAGGTKALAAKLGATRQAVHNWRTDGIPFKHWPVLLKMGFAADELQATRPAPVEAAQ